MEPKREEQESEFEVDPDNWDTVMVFLALQTQWRRELPAMSGKFIWHGLRYTEAETVIRLMGFRKKQQTIFAGLRTMEAAALPLLNQNG